ncbi:MAG TPA: ATP-binding protein [Steroidobacteraceae bacterium]|nr:ATP-binding protein [Steroidobacteraceae bacterium]
MNGSSPRLEARHARRSVGRKLMLVALVTTAIALLVAGISLLTRDLHAYRVGLGSDLQTEAGILALSTGPALAFNDRAAADRNVAALSVRPNVFAVAIYDDHGRLFAQYVRRGESPPPPRVPQIARGLQFSGGRIDITHRIVQNGERLGTIYLRGRYDVRGRVEAYLGILAIVGVLSLCIALALSAVLQRSITDPLSSMAHIARQVIRQRDYSLRAQRGGQDEIGLVVDAFNGMLDEIQLRTRALEESNTTLQKEVVSRQSAEAELRAADRRKDEFLATLAHELRNPLAPIAHAVKLLEIAGTDERRREWAREVIGRQVRRMALLLDDLLDVSRITRGRLQLRKSRVELTAVVRSAVETARPLIEAKQHALTMRLPDQPIEIEADPLRLSQALSNLLTNAAKYSDQGSQIAVVAELTAQELRFSVRDTGIGLTPASIPMLFEMFSQVDSAIDRAEGGLGIGLALVKGLIALHGGTIDAASEGPGRGSTFTIHLPRSLAAPSLPGAGATAPAVSATAAWRCSVLVADDNRDAADSLAQLLNASGHVTHVAYSGGQALEIALREHPDACILDIGMPEMTGYEVAQRLRAASSGRHLMLIAVTGWGQQEDKQKAEAAGFDHHLTKPVEPGAVEMLLHQFASRA